MKKVLSLVMTALVATSLFVGCKKAEPAKTPATETEAKPDFTKEVEEFTILMGSVKKDSDNWNSEVAKRITEKTGVKLKFEYPVGDWKEKVGMMVASGEYPDLIANQDDSLTTLVNAGALVKLDDLIDQYGPNIKNFWGDRYNRLRFTKEDPSIYGFGYGNVYNDSNPGYMWNISFNVQHAVLKELGYPQIKTLQDFENVLKAYKEKHPTIDGKETIPLTLITSDGWRYFISLTNPSYYVDGQPDNGEWYVDEKTGTVKYHYTQEQRKEYFKWLNHLIEEGLLDKESFTQSYDDYKAKIASGRVLGLIDARWEYMEPLAALEKDGKFDRLYMTFPVTNNGAKWAGNWSTGNAERGGISITTKCKNPEKIVNFFNYLASEEGQLLKEWGIEGVNYTVENGKRVRNPKDVADDLKDPLEFIKRTGVKCYRYEYWLTWGQGGKLSDGSTLCSEDPEATVKNFSPVEKETLAAYGVKDYTGMFPQDSEFPSRPYGGMASYSPGKTEEVKAAWGKIQGYVLPDITKCILEKSANFDANWEAFMNHIKDAGLDKVEAEMTQEYKDRLELYK